MGVCTPTPAPPLPSIQSREGSNWEVPKWRAFSAAWAVNRSGRLHTGKLHPQIFIHNPYLYRLCVSGNHYHSYLLVPLIAIHNYSGQETMQDPRSTPSSKTC